MSRRKRTDSVKSEGQIEKVTKFNTPKSTTLCFFKLFLDQVYRPYSKYLNENEDVPRMYISDEHRNITPNGIEYARFEYRVYMGDWCEVKTNMPDDSIRVSDYFFRDLTPVGIADYLKEDKKAVQSVFRPIIGNEKYTPPATEDSIRKALGWIKEDKEILLRTKSKTHSCNTKWYFPNESQKSFMNLIESLRPLVRPDTFGRYSFIFNTEYFRLCLTKQFVLDILKKTGLNLDLRIPIQHDGTYTFKNGNGETITIPSNELKSVEKNLQSLPIVGRYPKKYEDPKTNAQFKEFVKDVEEYCLSPDCLRLSDLERHFFGTTSETELDCPVPEDRSRIDLLKRISEKICDDLDCDFHVKKILGESDHFKAYLDKIDSFDISKLKVNHGLDKDRDLTNDLPIIPVFFADPDGTYREEDPWACVKLSEGDIGLIRETEIRIDIRSEKETPEIREDVVCSPMQILNNEKIEGRHYKELVDEYPDILDKVILPILSLIQFSPSALFYFVCEQNEWMETCRVDEDNEAFDPFKLIEELTKKAIKDHLNNMSVIGARYPIHCYCAGNVESGGRIFPSVLTFRLGEKHMMSLAWSEYIPNHGNNSRFVPYLFNGLPRYSQRVLDIVKMSSLMGSPFRDFLISALVEHDSEWREYVQKKRLIDRESEIADKSSRMQQEGICSYRRG